MNNEDNNNKIKCPKCGHEFPVSEGLMSHLKEEASMEIEKKLRKEIEDKNNLEVQDLKRIVQEKDANIKDFKEKELELETQRRFDEQKKKIEEDTAKRIAEENKFKDLEKDKKLADMSQLVEE